MESLAYLHLACTYQGESSELVSLGDLFNQAPAPNWKTLSSKAWKYMLPLAITLSLLNTVSSVLALEKPENLPEKLQSPVTQTYHSSEQIGEHLQKALKKAPSLSANSTNQQVVKISSVTNKRKNPKLLSKGDEGEDVRVLQERLRVAGFYYGNATGIFGPITEESVKNFQKAYKLSVDGVVGAATLAKLPPVEVSNGADSSPKTVSRDTLNLGDRGEAVRIVQEQLMKTGYLEGQITGYYGSHTAEAVRKFQKNQKLEINGIADQNTRSKLHSLAKTSPKSDFNVLEIQRRLQERGFYKGPINGMMATDTRKAIKRAQEFYGVSLSDIKKGGF
ncbi:peptidoglycan-binding protein [Cronbergia sp. UHCC 0137]|uniref:peptidoglycan-binding protein n=1 Tax=Cronbergia sp. UHCC 0137 TaxID=3110239 RepID=UPI002B1FDABC|nr:peptidoglycan-binding protein [Cronbergia sp. UHCC 0137]MEA5621088.1 peptidoglycan-binding protein [Cronbergia sp. UHCC 0137]